MGEAKIRKLVIDSLKPREISLVDLSKALCEVYGANNVSIVVNEVDANTETVTITVEGDDVDFQDLIETISEYGCAIRSIDAIEVYKDKSKSK